MIITRALGSTTRATIGIVSLVAAGLKEIAAKYTADEIIVLTVPHLVEEFFHRDLASRLRKATDLPTLRLMAHVALD